MLWVDFSYSVVLVMSPSDLLIRPSLGGLAALRGVSHPSSGGRRKDFDMKTLGGALLSAPGCGTPSSEHAQ